MYVFDSFYKLKFKYRSTYNKFPKVGFNSNSVLCIIF